ncbi:hypothetical protein H6G81_25755, partial [Scytonema hofmannii FACHB-248]
FIVRHNDSAQPIKWSYTVAQMMEKFALVLMLFCTKGFWNGGLIFKGETYKNTQLLYETITDILGGDPFDSIEWFNELLGWVLADPTKMAADAYLGGDNFSAYANYCRRVVKAAKEPIKIPDISEFTGEDAAFLATFLGVF